MPVSPTLRAKILEEARYRCGDCLIQQLAINWLLEVEHIIPMSLSSVSALILFLIWKRAEETYDGIVQRVPPNLPLTHKVIRHGNHPSGSA